MSVLSGVSLAQLEESFRRCGRGHGVVDISAAAALAVPRLVDCAPRAQSGAFRGQLVLIAHVEIDGVAMAIVVVAFGKRWALRTLLVQEYALARALDLACSPRVGWSYRGGLAEPAGAVLLDRLAAADGSAMQQQASVPCALRCAVHVRQRGGLRRGSVSLALEGSDPEGQLYGPPAADQSGSMSARVDIGPRGPIRQ